jgi:hypothetical protein
MSVHEVGLQDVALFNGMRGDEQASNANKIAGPPEAQNGELLPY